MPVGCIPRRRLRRWPASTRSRLPRGRWSAIGSTDPGTASPDRALHTIVVARLRDDPDTRAYAARRAAQGKSPREIRRCLKRFVARQLFKLLESCGQPDAEILRAA
jgi:hypothetical protein